MKVGLREDSARAGGAVGHQFGFELRSIWEEKAQLGWKLGSGVRDEVSGL